MASKYLIYALVDPLSSEWRYIGKSCSGLKRPSTGHKVPANLRASTYKNHWVKSLLSRGLCYCVEVLEEFDSPDQLSEAEVEWIAEARRVGVRLTNATDGGEGLVGLRHTDATKRKMAASQTGKKHSLATRRRLAEIAKPQDRTAFINARGAYWTPARCAENGQHLRELAKGPVVHARLVAQGRRAHQVAGDQCLAALRTEPARKNHALAQKNRFSDPAVRVAESRKRGGRPITDGATVYDTVADAARMTGVPRANIQAVLRGARQTAGGRTFSYSKRI